MRDFALPVGLGCRARLTGHAAGHIAGPYPAGPGAPGYAPAPPGAAPAAPLTELSCRIHSDFFLETDSILASPDFQLTAFTAGFFSSALVRSSLMVFIFAFSSSPVLGRSSGLGGCQTNWMRKSVRVSVFICFFRSSVEEFMPGMPDEPLMLPIILRMPSPPAMPPMAEPMHPCS